MNIYENQGHSSGPFYVRRRSAIPGLHPADVSESQSTNIKFQTFSALATLKHHPCRRKHSKWFYFFPSTGCGVLHLLGPHSSNISFKVVKALRHDHRHRVYPNHQSRLGLFEQLPQPLPLRVPVGELSKSVQEGDVVRSSAISLHPGGTRNEVNSHTSHRKWSGQCRYPVRSRPFPVNK